MRTKFRNTTVDTTNPPRRTGLKDLASEFGLRLQQAPTQVACNRTASTFIFAALCSIITLAGVWPVAIRMKDMADAISSTYPETKLAPSLWSNHVNVTDWQAVDNYVIMDAVVKAFTWIPCVALIFTGLYGWTNTRWIVVPIVSCGIVIYTLIIRESGTRFTHSDQGGNTFVSLAYIVAFVFSVGLATLIGFKMKHRTLGIYGFLLLSIASSVVAMYQFVIFRIYYSSGYFTQFFIRTFVNSALKTLCISATSRLSMHMPGARDTARHITVTSAVVQVTFSGRFMQISNSNIPLVVLSELVLVFLEFHEMYG
jgi:hypothetical protein